MDDFRRHLRCPSATASASSSRAGSRSGLDRARGLAIKDTGLGARLGLARGFRPPRPPTKKEMRFSFQGSPGGGWAHPFKSQPPLS